MDFTEYQELAVVTCNQGLTINEALAMTGLGLGGEAGECVDIIKKHLFHGHELSKDKLTKELGDVLWYIAVMSNCMGINLRDVAEQNIEKLKKRYPEGFSEAASRNRNE